jgi:hypothetical protein
MNAKEAPDYPMTLARVANYLFLQMCVATCNHMINHEWYTDAWEFVESLLDTEKLECQRSANT